MRWPKVYDTQCSTLTVQRWQMICMCETHLGEALRGIGHLLCPVSPGLSVPPLGTRQPWPWSRCHDHAVDAETRYSSAPHSTQEKINGLCTASKQWKAFSHQKILPLSHLSPFSSTPRPNNRPCVVTPGLELHSPCVRLWTIHKTKRPCDPSHSSHTLAPQIYWIVFSPVIDTPPDAADEDAPLTRLHFVFDNSSTIIIEKLNFDDVNWWELGLD